MLLLGIAILTVVPRGTERRSKVVGGRKMTSYHWYRYVNNSKKVIKVGDGYSQKPIKENPTCQNAADTHKSQVLAMGAK